ncbi:inner membrane CreD family protein [bacterium]|nr:inner membrane CreD family protein [bacterium]
MSVKKLAAIIFIYIMTFIAWMILGASNLERTNDSFRKLKSEVVSLYGDALNIHAPVCYSKIRKIREEIVDGKKVQKAYFEQDDLELSKSDIRIQVHLDQRKKGNLWFPTFRAAFSGAYEFKVKNTNKSGKAEVFLYTTLKSANSIYDNIQLAVNDRNMADVTPLIQKKEIPVTPMQDGTVRLKISYDCTGMESIMYFISPGPDDITQINHFTLKMITDFKNYDFPKDMMSPLEKEITDQGTELVWRFNKSVTGKDIGLIIPNRLNPGEIVSRVTFFAPVPLLFFFIVLFMISILSKIDMHPMNYFFLAATFFSFHLMYSYFSDHLNIYVTFVIASVVSLLLTVTYLRLFTPGRLAYLYAPLTQIIYLIIFSYSFFFKGMTGMIVTICAVITLFILMQMTARLNWEQVFGRKT